MGKISLPQGKGSLAHNRRDNKLPKHIDQNRTCNNITLVDKNLKKAYSEIFGPAVADYNAKQSRNDRKIKNYMDNIRNSKNGEKLFYEDILQWGCKDDYKANPKLSQVVVDCYQEYFKSWNKRNPALKLIGYYIHMDEASPHVHLDYIPVATGYKNGMDTRNSLTKAMQSMGFEDISKHNNSTKAWKERERAYFAVLCRVHGLVVDKEKPSTRDNYDIETYKAYKESNKASKELTNLNNELTKTTKQLSKAKTLLNANAEEIVSQRELIESNAQTLANIYNEIGRLKPTQEQKEFDKSIFSVDKHNR